MFGLYGGDVVVHMAEFDRTSPRWVRCILWRNNKVRQKEEAPTKRGALVLSPVEAVVLYHAGVLSVGFDSLQGWYVAFTGAILVVWEILLLCTPDVPYITTYGIYYPCVHILHCTSLSGNFSMVPTISGNHYKPSVFL